MGGQYALMLVGRKAWYRWSVLKGLVATQGFRAYVRCDARALSVVLRVVRQWQLVLVNWTFERGNVDTFKE